MIKEKISSQEIIDLVASKASVSKRAAEEFLKVMIASVEEGLLAGEIVKIKNLGTFKLQWNEPRKSVNIHTREEITITGYFKVVFVPDAALKGQVNEPFAHLEPVVLEGDSIKNEIIEEPETVSDPLRIFNEQAFEIKNLISEIQALSKNSNPSIKEEDTVQNVIIEQENKVQAFELAEDGKVQINTIEEVKSDYENKFNDDNPVEILKTNQTKEDSIHEVDSKLIKVEKQQEQQEHVSSKVLSIDVIEANRENPENDELKLNTDLPTTPYLDNIKPLKKSKAKLWFFLILFLLIGSGAGLYLFYSSNSELSSQYSFTNISDKISISEISNSISGWFTPTPKPTPKTETIVIPKDTNVYNTINQNRPIDSTQILFDNPRVYTNFIASERIKSGSRLTIMSKRYYGNKDFWVYIYEANKSRIPNPDNIPVGTIIQIPNLNPRLVDVSDPRCLEKAKELHDIYIK